MKEVRGNMIEDQEGPQPKEINPKEINLEGPLWDTFGNIETERSAWWIVKYCQEKGGWVQFTYEEIGQLVKGFRFNQLLSRENKGKYITIENEEYYQVTQLFIEKCYKSSSKGAKK
jgi:hypothetical protein